MMDPISFIDSVSGASKAQGTSLAGRALSSFGDEITQLIDATLEGSASPTLGANVDMKA
jgi:hypothetical protein